MSMKKKDPLAAIDLIPRELLPAALARIASRLLEAQAAKPNGDRLLTPDQAAERLGVSVKWVYRHQDDLGAVRLSGRALRIPAARLEAYVAQQD
jgi:excisionase family DNA binding protein